MTQATVTINNPTMNQGDNKISNGKVGNVIV